MDRIANVAANVGAEFIDRKLAQAGVSPATAAASEAAVAAFLASSARAITNAGALNIVPSLAINGTTQVFYVAPSCIRCSARPVVSSVGSRAAYCWEHWERLWCRDV